VGGITAEGRLRRSERRLMGLLWYLEGVGGGDDPEVAYILKAVIEDLRLTRRSIDA